MPRRFGVHGHLHRSAGVLEALAVGRWGSGEQHRHVEVRHRSAAACRDAAAQERGTRFRVLFLYDGACGIHRIPGPTISTGSAVRTRFHRPTCRGEGEWETPQPRAECPLPPEPLRGPTR
ncbi:hypothetical protein E6R61_05525 [Streptomyces sp. LRa12]|nr:hypothetical protein E6R61_05525 [Streptomyces sp. LRa12]